MLKEGFDDWEHAFVGNGTASDSTNGLGASGKPHTESRKVSYFGRLGWNWKETYMVNATLRADGSSNFAKGNRFGYFPSVSAGWTITNEKFMESTQNWLDFLKLRASWGQVGNANIDAFQYLAPIKSTNTHYLSVAVTAIRMLRHSSEPTGELTPVVWLMRTSSGRLHSRPISVLMPDSSTVAWVLISISTLKILKTGSWWLLFLLLPEQVLLILMAVE